MSAPATWRPGSLRAHLGASFFGLTYRAHLESYLAAGAQGAPAAFPTRWSADCSAPRAIEKYGSDNDRPGPTDRLTDTLVVPGAGTNTGSSEMYYIK